MNTNDENNNFALSGNWKNTTFWYFYISTQLPENAIATTATGLIIWENKLVLVEHKTRGWEIPGGHIEEGESIHTALIRELKEEAGLVNTETIEMFGYNKIVNPDAEKINKATGKPYPKNAYNVHYIIETKLKPIGCQDGSCNSVGFFDINSAEVQNSKVKDIIILGYNYYRTKKA